MRFEPWFDHLSVLCRSLLVSALVFSFGVGFLIKGIVFIIKLGFDYAELCAFAVPQPRMYANVFLLPTPLSHTKKLKNIITGMFVDIKYNIRYNIYYIMYYSIHE